MSAPASGEEGQADCRDEMADKNAQENLPPIDAQAPADEAMLVQLQALCERFGASPEVSPLMARQLVKRARQLALERDCTEAQALEYLLGLMVEASQGGGGPQSPL